MTNHSGRGCSVVSILSVFRYLEDGCDKYVVSELPTPMWHDVHIPPPMACGELVNSFVEIDVWMNSDNGKKVKMHCIFI